MKIDRFSWFFFPALVLALDCAPSSGTGPSGPAGSGGGSAFGGSGGRTNTDGSMASNGDSGGPAIVTGAAGRPGSSQSDGSCVALPFSAEQVVVTTNVPITTTVTTEQPVALYIMLDESGSMREDSATGGLSKWQVVYGGISAFVNDPSSSGLDVALRTFPPPKGSSGGACPPTDCSGTGYDVPDVAMATLPGNAAAIVAGMPMTPQGNCTPTEPALHGAENYCVAYQAQHPNEKCVVVFVTDGVPNGCSSTQSTLAGYAGTAFQQSGVLTFAIGMNVAAGNEVDFGLLNAIAVAGGTNCNPPNAGNEACNISGGSDFSAALAAIRKTVTVTTTTTVTKTEVKRSKLACTYEIPAPPPGETFDAAKVNIHYTGPSGTIESVYRSDSLLACGRTKAKSWYYDDPANPTHILMCPDTCSAIQESSPDVSFVSLDAGKAPRVDVLLGCTSVFAPPA